jgi:hypothetical protein
MVYNVTMSEQNVKMQKRANSVSYRLVAAILMVGSAWSVRLMAQPIQNSAAPVAAQTHTSPPSHTNAGSPTMGAQSTAPATKLATGTPVRNLPSGLPKRAKMYYATYWGVDSLRVKAAESGELIRFSWHVLDPDKAAPLNDKKAEPFLLDSQAGVKLVVPMMEKVGQLRQASTPVADKSYWMAFSNPGRKVKPGDFVSVVIGQFHAIGLVVE